MARKFKIIIYYTQPTIIKAHRNNMLKHIKLLQSGSDRYHGLHKRVKAKSCQCRTVGEVSGPVLKGAGVPDRKSYVIQFL